MNNPKTTIMGGLVVLGALAQIAVHWMSGTTTGISEHITEIVAALAGLGLIAAKDGGK